MSDTPTLHGDWRIEPYQTESGRWSARMYRRDGETHYLGVKRGTAAEAVSEARSMCDLMDGRRVGFDRAAEMLDVRRVDDATDAQLDRLAADVEASGTY